MSTDKQPVSHLIPRTWPPEDLRIVAANGCVLRTDDGSELLDAASGGLARHLSYHGASLSALALGARTSLRSLVAPMLQAIPHLPPPYPYRPEWRAHFPGAMADIPGLASTLSRDLTEAEKRRGARDPAAALEVAIEVIGPERVCAFIAEPIIGASGGAVVPQDDYWPRVRDI